MQWPAAQSVHDDYSTAKGLGFFSLKIQEVQKISDSFAIKSMYDMFGDAFCRDALGFSGNCREETGGVYPEEAVAYPSIVRLTDPIEPL